MLLKGICDVSGLFLIPAVELKYKVIDGTDFPVAVPKDEESRTSRGYPSRLKVKASGDRKSKKELHASYTIR